MARTRLEKGRLGGYEYGRYRMICGRVSWYTYVSLRPSMHVLANGEPAQALGRGRVIAMLYSRTQHSLVEV